MALGLSLLIGTGGVGLGYLVSQGYRLSVIAGLPLITLENTTGPSTTGADTAPSTEALLAP